VKDYYLEGEERFGPVMSPLYGLASGLSRMKGIYKFVADDLRNARWTRILDVGTGPGDVPALIAKEFKSRRIYAVDPSSNMLGIAKSRTKDLGVKLALGSSRHVPFKIKFDIIISTLSFHHWKEKETSLKYLAGLLEKRGEIRIYEFERKELTGLLKYFTSTHSIIEGEVLDIIRKSGLKVNGVAREDGMIRIAIGRK